MGASTTWFDGRELEVGEIGGGELRVGEIERGELKVGVTEGGELKVGVIEGGELKVGVIDGGYANLTGSIPARPCTLKSGPSKIRGAMITTPFAVTMPDPLIRDRETG
jgi:hypothetical protein